ncbi:hypothetical protein CYLTODRAFT_485984 [Cylindrobasidium torrendii FP15055 ss-10]|uniref:Uncharacterized protein n=1 Tax=Cylindrobasidium torrendii FP15055 ss-10 TaxID=1314674 RepID=A0A0D7BRA1_9AGAR|nr:hypothetical protein CYLTODRAFT_485984 [Cylindrobasidium torrendii FP15055 ss-10]
MRRPSTASSSTSGTGRLRNRLSLILQPSRSKPKPAEDAGSPALSPTSSIATSIASTQPGHHPTPSNSSHTGLSLRSFRSPDFGSSAGHPRHSTTKAINPPSVFPTPAPDPLPPTTNALNGQEKAMLLKKARKLSKVFGELPTAAPVPEEQIPPAAGQTPPPASRMRVHSRSRSIASSAPSTSTSIPAVPKVPRRRPSQPDLGMPTGSQPSLPQIKESRLSHLQIDPSEMAQHEPAPGAGRYSGESTTGSVGPGRSIRSMRPRASSVASLATSSHDDSAAIPAVPAIPTTVERQKARAVRARRRRSLDAIDAALVTAAELPRPQSAESTKMNRSRSFGAKKASRVRKISQDTLDFRKRYNDTFGDESEIKKRLRALNVQRARKMAKLFGEDPPSNLINITDDSRVSVDRNSTYSEYETENRPPTPVTPTTPMAPQPAAADAFTSDFRDRRRRAEKLSRFFGVAYQTIDVPPPTFAVPPPMAERKRSQEVQVDVTVTGNNGKRFWALDGGKTREADMLDVRDRLRSMKAG